MTLMDKACFERGCICYDSQDHSEYVEVIEKKEWVGLTWEEIDECFKITPDQYLPAQIYKRIEAKLKQKNGYTEKKNT